LARGEPAVGVTVTFFLLCVVGVLLSKVGTFAGLQNEAPFFYRDL